MEFYYLISLGVGVLCLLGTTVWAILAIYYSYLPQTGQGGAPGLHEIHQPS